MYEQPSIPRPPYIEVGADGGFWGSGLLYERVPCSESDAAIIAARPRRNQKVRLKGELALQATEGFSMVQRD